MAENLVKPQKKKRVKCLACLNYMLVTVQEDGSTRGQCPVCKTIIVSRQHSPKEQHIKLISTT